MIKKFLLAATIWTVSVPAVAEDGWWTAESDHFRVYSSGTQDDAKQMAINLERLDQAMRLFRGLPLEGGKTPESAKPTVYQFGNQSDIGRLAGSDIVAGFFIPRAGDSVAFVPLKEGSGRRDSLGTRPDDKGALTPGRVLFHEYAHYFMFQYAPAAYPFWYIEGFAELFGMLQLVDGGFNLGEPPEHRSIAIRELSFDVEKLLDPQVKDMSIFDLERQYAYGWMFTSYLSFEPSRQGQLANYLRLINSGKKNLDAAREAFGDLGKLQKELEKYRMGRARAISVKYPATSAPVVQVRQLNEDEAAQMMLHIQSSAGVTESKAKRLVPDARALVARYPQSVPVLMSATEAEFDAKNLNEAEALAKRVIAQDSKSVEARLYLARIAMERAKTDPAQLKTARQFFIEANKLDNDQPEALTGYYLTFVIGNESPPEDALLALESAFRFAPFDQRTRLILAYQLLVENRDSEALLILGPVVNSPHGGKTVEKYRDLVEKAKAGDRTPLLEKLRPSLSNDDEDDES